MLKVIGTVIILIFTLKMREIGKVKIFAYFFYFAAAKIIVGTGTFIVAANVNLNTGIVIKRLIL